MMISNGLHFINVNDIVMIRKSTTLERFIVTIKNGTDYSFLFNNKEKLTEAYGKVKSNLNRNDWLFLKTDAYMFEEDELLIKFGHIDVIETAIDSINIVVNRKDHVVESENGGKLYEMIANQLKSRLKLLY